MSLLLPLTSLFVFLILCSSEQYYISNQTYYEYDNEMQVAYPVNVCTRVGSDHSSNPYSKFQCDSSGGALWGPCSWASDSTCTQSGDTCTNDKVTDPTSPGIPIPGENGETCPNDEDTTSTNYMEIHFYGGYLDEQTPSLCPSDNDTFSFEGFARLSTNICVQQYGGDYNGNYFMASCNNETAEIGIFSDSACSESSKSGVYISYTRWCQLYYTPSQSNKQRFYRTVGGCIVNGTDILSDTATPTISPTKEPTVSPTINPTTDPTVIPTAEPTTETLSPSVSPSVSPTVEPTMEPTIIPTISPSDVPTTREPTNVPTMEPTEEPEATLPDAGQVLAELDNVSLIWIVCGVLIVFYLFICCYIWSNERRKRKRLTTNFQKGSDREQRIAYLREKNQQRRDRLRKEKGININGDHNRNNNNNGNHMQVHMGHDGHRGIDENPLMEQVQSSQVSRV